jgi:16S rRNA (cytidine1402-2'-O)-methyltransferase
MDRNPVERIGTLYIVATPIGNLEDMSYRAVRTLREVDVIAAEDTRHTRILLAHYEIGTPMCAHHAHNEQEHTPQLIARMCAGQDVALVSDAGTPLVSDPGSGLIAEAIRYGIAVVPIPGPVAAVAAWIASGIHSQACTMHGFLPRTQKKARAYVRQYAHDRASAVFYEAPHRLVQTIALLISEWGGGRRAVVAREMTKRHEQFIRGTLDSCMEWAQCAPVRGECALVVEGMCEDDCDAWWEALSINEHVAVYERAGHTHKEAMRLVAVDRKQRRRDVYAHMHAPSAHPPQG